MSGPRILVGRVVQEGSPVGRVRDQGVILTQYERAVGRCNLCSGPFWEGDPRVDASGMLTVSWAEISGAYREHRQGCHPLLPMVPGDGWCLR